MAMREEKLRMQLEQEKVYCQYHYLFSGSLPSHDSLPLPSTSTLPPTPPSSTIFLQMKIASVRKSEHKLKKLATAVAEVEKKVQEWTALKQKHDGE